MSPPNIQKTPFHVNGIAALVTFFLLTLATIATLYCVFKLSALGLILIIPTIVIFFVASSGIVVLQPNSGIITTLFGAYSGILIKEGIYWINPLLSVSHFTVKAHNFQSDTLKVNDLEGNPIDVSAVVVWKIKDAYKAHFAVESYEEYLPVQAEVAIREVISKYPYDCDTSTSIRSGRDNVEAELTVALQREAEIAGLDIVSVNINHVAYAPEIAQVMLKRQQAKAIGLARKVLVDAVEQIVAELTTKLETKLEKPELQKLTRQLLVSLTSDRGVDQVLNLEE